MGRRKRWYTISGVFIVDLHRQHDLIRGFNFGIDFKGGAEFDFPANGHTVTQARAALDGTGVNGRGRAVDRRLAAEDPHPDQADHGGADARPSSPRSSRRSTPRAVEIDTRLRFVLGLVGHHQGRAKA